VRAAGADDRPRLLILTPDYPPQHGGVQVLVHRLATGMRGFQTEVVTLHCAGAAHFDDGEARVATRRVARRPRGCRRARIVSLNVAGVRRAARFRPQVTLSAHAVTSPAAAVTRRLFGGRTAQYFYGIEIVGRPRLAALAANRADTVIAISAYTASLLSASGAKPAGLTVIPPGVDLPRDPSPLPSECPTVLTIGQLRYAYKGHDVLIDALARVRVRVPNVRCVVIGDGPLRSRLEALARTCGVAEAISFLGAVSDLERDRWLRRADVFAMPSRLDGEGFGMVFLEASAHGKPIVAGNVGGSPEAVADGASGMLVDPTDPAAVADALARLLLDRELARRLGRGGAERARDFHWPLIAQRVEGTLLELAGKAP
jgi:phosphatidylinositol alpha-1,6-mannosyltransferase